MTVQTAVILVAHPTDRTQKSDQTTHGFFAKIEAAPHRLHLQQRLVAFWHFNTCVWCCAGHIRNICTSRSNRPRGCSAVQSECVVWFFEMPCYFGRSCFLWIQPIAYRSRVVFAMKSRFLERLLHLEDRLGRKVVKFPKRDHKRRFGRAMDKACSMGLAHGIAQQGQNNRFALQVVLLVVGLDFLPFFYRHESLLIIRQRAETCDRMLFQTLLVHAHPNVF